MLKFVVLCLFLGSAYGAVLPQAAIDRNCRRFDPNINSCLARRAQELLPVFCDGIKSLNIPTFDPLHINALEYSENKGNLQITAKMKQVTLTGHKQAKFETFTFDPRSLSGVVKLKIPQLRMRSNLHAKGSVLGFPIDNQAVYNWLFTGVEFEFSYKLKSVNHQGQEYLILDDLQLKSHSDNGFLQLQSTDPANKGKDETLANAFNSNPRLVMDHMNDFMSKSSAALYKSVFNYVLHRIPANDMLPPQ